MQVVPLRLVPAVAVEDLDAMVLAVGHVHPAVRVAADVVRDVELAGIGARLAPRQRSVPSGRILVDAGVAVAVGDVEVALRATARCACSGGTARRSCTASAPRARRSSAAPCRRACSGERCGRRRRSARSCRRAPCARRARGGRCPRPTSAGSCRRGRRRHGVRAAVERVDPILRVDADRRDVGVELTAGRQLRPVVDDLVAIGARCPG